jgi:hypothetical protein
VDIIIGQLCIGLFYVRRGKCVASTVVSFVLAVLKAFFFLIKETIAVRTVVSFALAVLKAVSLLSHAVARAHPGHGAQGIQEGV